MNATLQITYSFDATLDRARQEGRDEAYRRLAGHQGYSTTLPVQSIAALMQAPEPATVGDYSSPIDDAE